MQMYVPEGVALLSSSSHFTSSAASVSSASSEDDIGLNLVVLPDGWIQERDGAGSPTAAHFMRPCLLAKWASILLNIGVWHRKSNSVSSLKNRPRSLIGARHDGGIAPLKMYPFLS